MKSQDCILDRVRGLLVEELDRRVKEVSERKPCRCIHNYRHALDTRKEIYGEPNDHYNRITVDTSKPVSQTIGLCMLGADDLEQWKGAICEDDIDAQRCPYFTSTADKGTVWQEFQRDVANEDWIAVNLPAVRELLWVVGGFKCPQLPWWKLFWYRWFLRIQVAPLLAVHDPALLPPGPDEPSLLVDKGQQPPP